MDKGPSESQFENQDWSHVNIQVSGWVTSIMIGFRRSFDLCQKLKNANIFGLNAT